MTLLDQIASDVAVAGTDLIVLPLAQQDGADFGVVGELAKARTDRAVGDGPDLRPCKAGGPAVQEVLRGRCQ